ncbi:MAG: F0F1 ATP synthase subunit A, partial [Vicinamibacterales bacterium]
MMFGQEHVQELQEHASEVAEKFNAGETIIEHVSNSSHDHPLIHLPTLFGIDFSVTKHVLMLWLVATFAFLVITITVRKYLAQDKKIPSGFMNALEALVEFIRDSIALPNVGKKWVNAYTPLLLTFFVFIFCANAIGLIPIFEILGILDHFVLHTGDHSIIKQLLHGGTTATANFNVTAALAVITFVAIIIAGSRAHGAVQHWINLVPHGLAWPLYILLIPIELMGMFVRPFALTMRLAAN